MEEHTDEVGGRGIKSQDGEISLRNEYEHLKKTMLHTNIFAMEQREFIVQRLFLLCGRRQAFLCEVGRWGTGKLDGSLPIGLSKGSQPKEFKRETCME